MEKVFPGPKPEIPPQSSTNSPEPNLEVDSFETSSSDSAVAAPVQASTFKLFEHLPSNKVWCTYIDFDRWTKPKDLSSSEEKELKVYATWAKKTIPEVYESGLLFDVQEPGYAAGMQNGIWFCEKTMNQPLDVELFVGLHDACVQNVIVGASRMPDGMRGAQGYKSLVHYCLKNENISNEAYQENYQMHYLYDYRKTQDSTQKPIAIRVSEFVQPVLNEHDELKNFASETIKKYHQDIISASTDDKKLFTIAELCKRLEICHCFQDGNQRTIAFILLNRELTKNGFPPCILVDPYCFDGGYSCLEIVEEIKKGQEVYHNLVMGIQPSAAKRTLVPI